MSDIASRGQRYERLPSGQHTSAFTKRPLATRRLIRRAANRAARISRRRNRRSS